MLRPQSYLGVATTGTAIQQPHAINTVNTEDDYDSEALFAVRCFFHYFIFKNGS